MNPIERYRKSEVMTADPAVLIRLLLEAGSRNIQAAIDACREGRIIERGHSATKAVELLTSLMVNLNGEESPQLAGSLRDLYEYCQYRVIQGHVHGDVKSFEAALLVLADITEAWVTVLQRENQSGEAGDGLPPSVEAAEPAWV